MCVQVIQNQNQKKTKKIDTNLLETELTLLKKRIVEKVLKNYLTTK